MLSTASKYPKKNLDCSLTLQNSSQKKRLGFESDVYHFDTCPRLLGLKPSKDRLFKTPKARADGLKPSL